MNPSFKPPRIEQKPAMTFVGVGGTFTAGNPRDSDDLDIIPQLWERYVTAEIKPEALKPECNYGVVYLLPETERQDKEELEYIAGTMVEPNEALPSGMVMKSVDPQTYAVFEHHGPVKELVRTVHFAFGHWLPRSGYRRADSPSIESYDARFSPKSETSIMEYWLPVAPLGG